MDWACAVLVSDAPSHLDIQMARREAAVVLQCHGSAAQSAE